MKGRRGGGAIRSYVSTSVSATVMFVALMEVSVVVAMDRGGRSRQMRFNWKELFMFFVGKINVFSSVQGNRPQYSGTRVEMSGSETIGTVVVN